MTGRTILHYELLEKLGEGGMGAVWKAEDTQLRRTVALKFLTAAAGGDAEIQARLVREAQASAALDHPNICHVYGIHKADGETFIAMAFVDGPSLADKIKQRPLPLDEALDLVMQIAKGLQEAHEKGIVHRDIKPDNVMLTSKGEVKIMDFGLAAQANRSKITKEGTTLGTPAYMSPEQLEAGDVDRRADLWALGCVLYEMLTQRTPFEADYEQAIAYGILNEDPEPVTAQRAGLPPQIDDILDKALAKNPAERYQTTADLIVDLKRLRDGKVSKRTVADAAPVPPPITPSPRKWIMWAGLSLAAVAGVVGYVVWPSPDAPALPKTFRERPLSFEPGSERGPSFSPDGLRVVYGADRHIFVRLTEAGAGQPVQITSGEKGGFQPDWSHDGTRIVFARIISASRIAGSRFQLVVAAPAPGASETVLGEFAGRANQIWPDWHPDGRHIGFSCRIDAPGTTRQLCVHSIESGETWPISMPIDQVGDGQILFAPDGRSAAYQAAGELFVQRLTEDLQPAGEPERVTTNFPLPHPAGWTPDSRSVLFMGRSAEAVEGLWVVEATAGADPRFVAGTGGRAMYPDLWLGESGEIRAAYTIRPRVESQIARFDFNQPQSREGLQLTDVTGNNFGAQFSPNGDRIAFISDRTGRMALWVMAVDGSGLNGPVLEAEVPYPFDFSWAPDGRTIVRAFGDVRIVDVETGRLGDPLIERSGFSPVFSKDGRFIYYLRRNRPGIWRIDVNSREDIEALPEYGSNEGLGLSADGRTLYLIHQGAFMQASLDEEGLVSGKPSMIAEGVRRFDVVNRGVYYQTDKGTLQFWDGTESTDSGIPAPRGLSDISPDERWYLQVQPGPRAPEDLTLLESVN